jgi:hypothetical protein
MENSAFISEPELLSLINDSAKKLYDILVSSNEDYNTLILPFDITSGNTSALPSDCYKVRGLDYQYGGDWCPLRRFQFTERETYSNSHKTNLELRYRLIKDSIYILPEERATGSYRLWYVPEHVDLVDETDTLDGKNGFEEYVILDVAMKCKIKEESDTTELERARNEALVRVTTMSQERDYGGPDRIADVRRYRDEEFYHD